MSDDVRTGALAVDRVRNRRMGAGVIDDPYPHYDELRAAGPVHEGTIWQNFGVPDYHEPVPGVRHFSAYDWVSVDRVLREDDTFSNAAYTPHLEPYMGRTILAMDGAEHRRYRALAQPGLARPDMARWEQTWVQPCLTRVLDDLTARPSRSANLVVDLCARLPVYTIAKAWGIDDTDVPRVHELALAQISVSPDGDTAGQARAASELGAILRAQVARRRAEPADDLISLMCAAELVDEEGERHRLTDDEVLSFAKLLLTAGAGTTYRGLGSLLISMLRHPDQFERVRTEGLAAAAVEEALRFESPLTAVERLVKRDCELGGVAIPAGSIVHASLGAANHDPARWSNPHRFDVGRQGESHVAFGWGAHFCLGIHLARTEMRAALDDVVTRLPGLRFDPDLPEPHMTGLWIRVPTAVTVVWN